MATLIEVRENGKCLGRCDAKCYNATSERCECICGGDNHGAGLKKAADNSEKHWHLWFEDYEENHPGLDLQFVRGDVQRELPGIDGKLGKAA